MGARGSVGTGVFEGGREGRIGLGARGFSGTGVLGGGGIEVVEVGVGAGGPELFRFLMGRAVGVRGAFGIVTASIWGGALGRADRREPGAGGGIVRVSRNSTPTPESGRMKTTRIVPTITGLPSRSSNSARPRVPAFGGLLIFTNMARTLIVRTSYSSASSLAPSRIHRIRARSKGPAILTMVPIRLVDLE